MRAGRKCIYARILHDEEGRALSACPGSSLNCHRTRPRARARSSIEGRTSEFSPLASAICSRIVRRAASVRSRPLRGSCTRPRPGWLRRDSQFIMIYHWRDYGAHGAHGPGNCCRRRICRWSMLHLFSNTMSIHHHGRAPCAESSILVSVPGHSRISLAASSAATAQGCRLRTVCARSGRGRGAKFLRKRRHTRGI